MVQLETENLQQSDKSGDLVPVVTPPEPTPTGLDVDELGDLGLFDDDSSSTEQKEEKITTPRKFSNRAIVRIVFVFVPVALGLSIFFNIFFKDRTKQMKISSFEETGATAEKLLAKQREESRAEIERLENTVAELENKLILNSQTEAIRLQTKKLSEKKQHIAKPTSQVEPIKQPTQVPSKKELPPPPPPKIITPVTTRQPPSIIRKIEIDPSALNRKVATSGHYRAAVNWDNETNVNKVTPTKNERAKKPEPIRFLSPERLLTRGTTVSGILQTQIGWEGQLGSIANKNFTIKLSQDLTSPSGKVIIPTGAIIIAKIGFAKATGEIELIAKEFQFTPKQGKVMVVPIPNQTVLIQDRDADGVLMARVTRKSTLGRDGLSALLGGAAEVSDLINRPQSSYYSSWDRGSSSTVVNGDPNLGAAFIGGVANQMNERMSRRNQEEIRRMETEAVVFLLRKNTQIEIYINENFEPIPCWQTCEQK